MTVTKPCPCPSSSPRPSSSLTGLKGKGLLSLAIGLASVVGCQSEVQQQRSELAEARSIAPTVKASAFGSIITHKDDATKSRIAQVQIPQGALAVNQKVTISSSYHTDPSDLKAEFGIKPGNKITETKVATVVSSNIDKNLESPMTIALDLPPKSSNLLSLTWDDRHFFVVYTVRDAKLKTWKRGIMPDSALTIRNNRVLFQSQLMGRYEIFESVAPIAPKTTEKTVTAPNFRSAPVQISKVSPLIADVGTMVTITGKYLSAKTKVFLGVMAISSTEYFKDPAGSGAIRFKVPQMNFGATHIKVIVGNNSDTYPFVVHTKSDGGRLPYIAANASDVCSPIDFINSAGHPVRGTKRCQLKHCNGDNQTDCLAVVDYPAFNTAKVDYNSMFNTLRVHGRSGANPVPSYTKSCMVNGQIGCRIDGRFISLEAGSLTADVIKKGVTLPQVFISTGSNRGVFPEGLMALSPKQAGYQNLVGGTAKFSEAIRASAGTTFNYWDRLGRPYTFVSDGSLKAEAILDGVTIHGVTGKRDPDAKTPCANSGMTNCSITAPYTTVAKTVLNPRNIRNKKKVGVVEGNYPSKGNELPKPNDQAPQLIPSQFNWRITSRAPFSYYNSAGVQQVVSGSGNISHDTIRHPEWVFGVEGKAMSPDTGMLQPHNIRHGVVLNGVTGIVRVDCRNQANTNTADFKEAPGKVGLDPYDTIADIGYPGQNPFDAQDKYACTASNWEDLTNSNGVKGCRTAGPNCVFKSNTTGLSWAGFDPNADLRTPFQGVQYCSAGTWLGKNWQLPAIDELLHAQVSGLFYLTQQHSGFLGSDNRLFFHSRSTVEGTGSSYYTLNFATGLTGTSSNNGERPVICVEKRGQ